MTDDSEESLMRLAFVLAGRVRRLKALVIALADRVHKQSELLSRKDERKSLVITEIDSCP